MREGHRAGHSRGSGIDSKGSTRVGDVPWPSLPLWHGWQFHDGRTVSEMSALREQYLAVCDGLIREIGTEDFEFVVPEDATLEQCVGYLEKYIVRDRKHFRYNRYHNMLAYCSNRLNSFGPRKGQETHHSAC